MNALNTYINPNKNEPLRYTDCPPLLDRYIKHTVAISNKARRTVNSYVIDILLFLRFYARLSGKVPEDTAIEKIKLKTMADEDICAVTSDDIFSFLYFLADDRKNSPSTRKHKLSSLRSFYNYILKVEKTIDKNPVDFVERPSTKGLAARPPKFLELDQAKTLLNTIDGQFQERDYCIILLFLTCGMRLSELTSINLKDISEKTVKIVGKGNKPRTIPLNQMCLDAIADYRAIRDALPNLVDKEALFVSKRTGKRIGNRQVEKLVSKYIAESGLQSTGCTTHSLRHSAATMYYRAGNDLQLLARILGHSSTKVTEIYTHIDESGLAKIIDNSPLADD